MRTWLLQDGDLVLGGAGFAEVTGAPKIAQDMEIATAEPFACDVYHPNWGSQLTKYIGLVTGSVTESLINAEVTRLINNYMTIQTATVNTAALNGTKSPYAISDLVTAINSIKITQSFDSYTVTVSLQTASNQTIVLVNTVTPSS